MQEYTVHTLVAGKLEKCGHTSMDQVKDHVRSLKGTGTLVKVFMRIKGKQWQFPTHAVQAMAR